MPIFDQGYQHWKGPLSSHAWRWFAITRHGVRIGFQGRVFRMVLLVSLLPAVALATALCLWGLIERQSDLVAGLVPILVSFQFLGPGVATDPKMYRVEIWTLCFNLFFSIELTLSMILIVLVGPSLISQDLRFNAFPLYLSRPMRRIDYLGGKLGVIAAFLGLAIIVPCLLTYGLGLLFTFDLTILKDTYRLLFASVAYGLVIIFVSGMLILALSSLSRSSRWVAKACKSRSGSALTSKESRRFKQNDRPTKPARSGGGESKPCAPIKSRGSKRCRWNRWKPPRPTGGL
jgi:ABC-2 type transport system permease protein